MSDLLTSKGAEFNAERTRRHRLWRIWDYRLPRLIVIGTNPSTADEDDNDATVSRVEERGRRLGYGGIEMINMMDIIETDSRLLAQMPYHERCSERNVNDLLTAIGMASRKEADILCAWGKPGHKFGSVSWLTTRAHRAGVTLFCLRTNKDGSPVHPLYQPYGKAFEWFGGVNAEDAAQPLCSGALDKGDD